MFDNHDYTMETIYLNKTFHKMQIVKIFVDFII